MENSILLEKEFLEIDKIWKEEYVTVLFLSEDLINQKSYYSAIIDKSIIKDLIKNYSWDVRFWCWKPWFLFSWDESEYIYELVII